MLLKITTFDFLKCLINYERNTFILSFMMKNSFTVRQEDNSLFSKNQYLIHCYHLLIVFKCH